MSCEYRVSIEREFDEGGEVVSEELVEHIAACEECRQWYESLKAVDRLLTETPFDLSVSQVGSVADRIQQNLGLKEPPAVSGAGLFNSRAFKYAATIAVVAGALWAHIYFSATSDSLPRAADYNVIAEMSGYIPKMSFSPEEIVDEKIDHVENDIYEAVSFITGCIPTGNIEHAKTAKKDV
ncbi:MAG: hypothetical protein AB7F23_03520 [Phycisphaerae bacterium]